jgi:hypothetical protein
MAKSPEKLDRGIQAKEDANSTVAPNLVDFFRRSPLLGVDLDLHRESDPGRDTEWEA